jgi:S1-C subfamily serine protease
MTLIESYEKVKPAVVAFTPKFHPVYHPDEPPPAFPPIFGTGFIIDDGIVITNDHVVKIIPRLPRPPDCPRDIWPLSCLLMHSISEKRMATIWMDVIGVIGIKHMEHGKHYYGSAKPDIAFVHVKMKKLPCVNVKYNLQEIKEGREIATAGFPMGTETLTAPGYLHQLTPTLQTGIISAVLPFQCETPHSLMINVMVQGGASGSPVFLPETGDVIGVLYGGLNEKRTTEFDLPKKIEKEIQEFEPSLHSHILSAPTNISYVVPAHYIKKMMKSVKEEKALEFPEDTLSLEECIKQTQHVERRPGNPPLFQIWEGEEKIKRTIKTETPNE